MPVILQDLQQRKLSHQPFACLTCYDATQARIVSSAGVEVLLVGDSLGNVVQGHSSTLAVSLDAMIYHTTCVARGNQGAWIMSDAPYLSYATLENAIHACRVLMQAGADCIKLECTIHSLDLVKALSALEIPLCAHLGLRPQSVHRLGGYKVQGRHEDSQAQLQKLANVLADAGVDMFLLECVPASLAASISRQVPQPVIGIGAGSATDAQVLVIYDLLGLHPNPPRFVCDFLKQNSGIKAACRAYAQAVRERRFPTLEQSY